ncbi:MAG: response regulator [Desulfobacteraceae bacterium]|jgi:DNA-binding NarL/FixJ family response regulator
MFKILIIEDNIKLRKRIKRILISKLPFLSVAEASDETEAFSEIEKKRPDLVIMDIRLAGENGLDLTKKIKMRYPFIPIVINTNNDSPEYKTAAVQVGADYFLSKTSNTINDLVSLAESIFLMGSEDTSNSYECG